MSIWIPYNNNYLYWRLSKPPVVPLVTIPLSLWEPALTTLNGRTVRELVSK